MQHPATTQVAATPRVNAPRALFRWGARVMAAAHERRKKQRAHKQARRLEFPWGCSKPLRERNLVRTAQRVAQRTVVIAVYCKYARVERRHLVEHVAQTELHFGTAQQTLLEHFARAKCSSRVC